MNLAHDFMNRLNEAAGRIGSGVREWNDGRTAASIDRLRDTLVPALDQFVAALTKSGRALQSATAPYLEQIADTTRSGAEALQENTLAGAHALGEMMQRRRGLLARHPYLIAMAVVGVGYVAVQRWRSHAATTGARRARPAAKGAKTASRSATRTSARTARGSARRQRPAATAANAGNTEKAIH